MKPFFLNKRLFNYQQRVNRLRGFTLICLFLLLVPISMVFIKGYYQFEKDLITEYEDKTEEITSQLNLRLFKRVVFDNAISTFAFDYYQHIYNPANKHVSKEKSPLSDLAYNTRYEGLLGYFQIDQEGQFNSPVWPNVIHNTQNLMTPQDDDDTKKRKNLASKLYTITTKSKELKGLIDNKLAANNEKFLLFSDVPGHLIFYRVVEVNNTQKLQGYVIDVSVYLNNQIKNMLATVQFNNTIAITLRSMLTSLDEAYFIYQGHVQSQATITQPMQLSPLFNQQVINKHELRWPFKDHQLMYSTSKLILPTAATYNLGLMMLLILGIVIGCYGFYRLGVKQLKLAEQQLNFVSSVSHELKTPLTSIRMYSEMLKSGIVPSEQYKLDYYDFIHCESERLSRLIDNILQLSKLNQPQQCVEAHYTKLSILINIIESKVSSLLINSDFKINISSEFTQPDHALLLVDLDAFSQVIINITDNAIKFFDSEKIHDYRRKKVDIHFKPDAKNKDFIEMEFRDYGEGISAKQESKIFELFYRGGSELTRSTKGTGIGLALVNELVLAQQGTIEAHSMSPGLSIKIRFKSKIQ